MSSHVTTAKSTGDRDRMKPVAPPLGYARVAKVAGLRLLSVLAGLVYVKYYTNVLSVEQVGEFFYLGTLSYVLNALVFVPIDSYMQARVSRLGDLPYPALGRLIALTLAAGLASCLVLSTPFVLMNLLRARDVPLLYAMAALLYLCSTVRNLLNFRGHSMFAAGMIVLESVARLLAFMAVAWALGASAQTLILSSVAALSTEFIILLWHAKQVLPLYDSSEPLDAPSHILRTASVLAGAASSHTVQLQAYRVLFPMAGYASTAAALGVTANIGAAAMSACAQVYSQIFLPRLYQSQGAAIRRYVGWASLLALLVFVVGVSLSESLVMYLTRAAYLPYAHVVGVGISIEAFNMLIGAYGVYLTLHGRAGVVFLSQLTGAVFSLAGCLTILVYLPESPLLIGLVVAGSQAIVTLALGLYVHQHLYKTLHPPQ